MVGFVTFGPCNPPSTCVLTASSAAFEQTTSPWLDLRHQRR